MVPCNSVARQFPSKGVFLAIVPLIPFKAIGCISNTRDICQPIPNRPGVFAFQQRTGADEQYLRDLLFIRASACLVFKLVQMVRSCYVNNLRLCKTANDLYVVLSGSKQTSTSTQWWRIRYIQLLVKTHIHVTRRERTEIPQLQLYACECVTGVCIGLQIRDSIMVAHDTGIGMCIAQECA